MLLRPRSVIASLAAVVTVLASSSTAAAAQQPTDSTSSFVTVSGTVYDSLNARPLSGALVQLATTDLHGRVLSTRTDLVGSFSIPDVRPGEYLVGFSHPFLDSLGLERPPVELRVNASDPIQLSLAVPSPITVRSRLCPTAGPSDSTGLMLGFLRDADTGLHLDSGRVVLEWTEIRVTKDEKGITPVRRSTTARATSVGWYALCGVPTAGPMAAQAEVAHHTSGHIDIRVPPRGVLHRDFSVPLDVAAAAVARPDSDTVGVERSTTNAAPLRRGSARLAGMVRDRNGKPLSGARLLLWGTDATTNAADDGTFALDKLPAGTQTLEARQIGYAAGRVVVDLANHRTDSVTVTLDKVADVLSEVTVYGKESITSRRLAGFRQRMRAGFGHFVTRADIEKRAPLRLTDLIRGIPGVAVERSGTFDYKVVSSIRRNLCHDAVVYVDGHRLIKPSSGGSRGSTTTPTSAPAPRAGQAPGAPREGTTAPASNDGPRSQVAGGQVSDSDFAPINDLVWLDDVVGVEVYSSGIFAPAEFGGSDTCPRVIVWTSPDAAALTRAGDDGDGR